ncbi:hypothetical protein PIB30_021601 [Stylosanthes scabra]|uniref:Uncharacterized protein n=1 Tax=Stylosanthes scabra TaxID=79078 RepID=A0ABU6V8S2_9FABA|nr:hypothetical protein [Stylosanthes scabra]
MDPEKQICQFVPNSSKEIKQFMADNLLTRTFYDPLDCEPSGFITRGFIKWWDAYYEQYNRSLDDIIKGATRKTNQIKEAEKAAEKEIKQKEAEKEKAEEATKEVQTEKRSRKRKPESSKTTSKRSKSNPKRATRTSDIPEEPNPSGVNPKSNSISEKTRPSESIQSSSKDSSKEASSKSKESTYSKKSKATKRIEESDDPEYEPLPTDHQVKKRDVAQSEESSKGYSRSPSPENINISNVENTKKVSNLRVNNPSSALTNKGILQKVVPLTPNIPIRPGTNRGIPIDLRVQFQERLEEARAENVKRVKESVKPLPSIPVIDIEADDELSDLLKVISETKARSEHVVSNSENKSIQQPPQSFQPPPQSEKEDSSI